MDLTEGMKRWTLTRHQALARQARPHVMGVWGQPSRRHQAAPKCRCCSHSCFPGSHPFFSPHALTMVHVSDEPSQELCPSVSAGDRCTWMTLCHVSPARTCRSMSCQAQGREGSVPQKSKVWSMLSDLEGVWFDGCSRPRVAYPA